MASIINALTGGGGVAITGDTSGNLALQTNNGTTAVTLDTAQNATFVGYANMPNTFGFKNRIINGAMMIDQRNAGASVTQTVIQQFVTDRWAIFGSQSNKFSAQQNAGSVTPPAGFKNYLGCTSLSSYTIGSGEAMQVYQQIEGLNCVDLGWGAVGAQTVTLSFWVRSSLTGTFGGAIKNSGSTRSYPYSYTISSANTWEQKTITIPGDTSGTWLTTNGLGISVVFSLGAGASISGAAGSWYGSDLYNATGATSVVGTNGATFYITGVQLEKGSTATSFDYRPYGTELQLCQRYYYKANNPAGGSPACVLTVAGVATSATQIACTVQFPVTLRTVPTALESTGSSADYYAWTPTTGPASATAAPVYLDWTSVNYGAMSITATGLTTGQFALVRQKTNSGFLAWSAEL